MSLHDTKIRSLKPSARPFKVSDSHGLYLLINPGGSRLWYLKYRINRKESRLGLGAYPDVSLARELTRLAVSLTLHLFIRSSELRFSRWSEIDFRNKIWTIPATREAIPGVRYSGRGSKMRTPHIVPLSSQSIIIRKQIREISEHQELIFPGDHNPYKPMCENTVNKALRLMGYDTKNEICGHGFRAMACSAPMESGLWSQDAVERQMSHQERNSVRAAYIHKAEYLEARKAMMQWWSDYLNACRETYIPPYIWDSVRGQTN